MNVRRKEDIGMRPRELDRDGVMDDEPRLYGWEGGFMVVARR